MSCDQPPRAECNKPRRATELLESLFPGEITDIPGFFDRSSRLRKALTPHICAVLAKGVSVVLDFPGNTTAQRAWFRELFERADAEHELHFVDASDALCKRQLTDRSKHLPSGTPWDDRCRVRRDYCLFSASIG
jgi:AAA domain